MSVEPETRRRVESLARDALEKFDSISTEATRELREARTNPDVFATPTTVAVRQLGGIRQELKADYRVLTKEPAIARVVIQYEDETERTWYICRATPTTIKDLASYRSPIGRLASLEVGSQFELPNGKVVEVLQQARFRPSKQSGEWDSHDTRVEMDFFGTITVKSLRAFLVEQPDDEQDDILGRILAEEKSQLIDDGVRRSVIAKMELRDQPVLDRFQDEIFRLPIDKRLLIVGPPGTGKTTTLIRRLGQKLDRNFLLESERRLVDDAQQFEPGATSHEDSWTMFTPTVLLKQYLKEAFARERVPASDQNITTWDDYRRNLARNGFRVLKAAAGKGIFVLSEKTQSLKSTAAQERLPQCFTEFDEWQRDEFMRRLRDSAHALATGRVSTCRKLGRRLEDVLKTHSDSGPDVSLLVSLSAEFQKVRQIVGGLKDESDSKINGALNLQLNRDSNFLDELARYVNDIQKTHSHVEEVGEDEIETEIDDEEDSAIHQTERKATINVYRRAVRAQARAAASRRAVRSASMNRKIIEWLGDDRTLAEPDRTETGIKLLAQMQARRFMNPAARYVNDMPRRYRTFRRRREHGEWYNDGIESNKIHPLELDFILLAILRAARGFLSNARVVQGIADPEWSFLRPVLQAYRHQVLVDEATDFSPIQLACMADLTHPKIRSFFACGDYNQRLATWGTRSEDDLKWACDGIEIKDVKISYRQTRQLSEFTREMMLITENMDPAVDLPANTDNDGPKPVLLENAADGVAAAWLAERIREIELFSNQLPSTAIFVNSEDDVEPVAKELNEAMIEDGIKVVPCPRGLAVGHDNDVRVFDVQHIKGLEFEAVFFVAVDRLADRVPTLFEKYLYVGATRAATYLGVTCEGALPQAIKPLQHHFGIDWK